MTIAYISRWLRQQARTFTAPLREVQLLKSGLWDPKRLLIVAAMLALVALPAFGNTVAGVPDNVLAKLSPELQAAANSGDKTVDVVVQFSGTWSGDKIKHAGAAGAVLKRTLKAINGGHFTINVKFLGALASLPDVTYVSLDRPLQMSAITTTSLVYPVQAVNADLAWGAGFNGQGIGVAVIDSGVSDRLDLHDNNGNSRVVYSQSFLPGVTDPNDYYGHGTHVAGIVGGNGAAANFNKFFSGIAPAVNIVNLRVLDANGSGTDSNVIAAIQRAIQLKSQYNIRIINLSLGRGVFESYKLDPLCQAVEAAWNAGIFVVVAAGNNGRDNSMNTQGYGTINSPGIDPYVITVGATLTNSTTLRLLDNIASYSSKGPTLIDHVVKPDIVAPGNQIVSLRDPGSTLANAFPNDDVSPAGVPVPTDGASYFQLSGTSMATPVVSGAAALLLQQHPELTPDQLKARLMKTAWKGFVRNSKSQSRTGLFYNAQYDVFTYGAGYVDVWAALQNNDVANGSAMSPVAVYNPLTGKVTLFFQNTAGQTICWGSSIVWGSTIVWGSQQFTDTASTVLWGSTVVWGSNTSTGFTVLWGSTIVWGSMDSQALSAGEDGETYIDPSTLTGTL
jgi:serine protease AprX